MTSDKERLMKEISTMFFFKHPNVMSIIGVCFNDEVPLIIMPYMMKGSVLDYVRHNRDRFGCNSLSEVKFSLLWVRVININTGGKCQENVSGCMFSNQ